MSAKSKNRTAPKPRPRIATVWLAGCSGCHMSFLDLDEWLFELAELADVVYSPVADVKEYPENVDAVLIEGAVANLDNLELLKKVRARTRLVVAFGDCAITGNVTSLRNPLGGPDSALHRAYVEEVDGNGSPPSDRTTVPELLPKVLPLHQVIKIDAFLRGCPPSPAAIRELLEQTLSPPSKSRSKKDTP